MALPSSVPSIRYDLASYGVVTQVLGVANFRVAGLVGHGDGAFRGYNVYVLKKNDGTITSPHAETRLCTAYSSSTGGFTHVAFTATLAVGDVVLLIHPSLSDAFSEEGLSYYGTVTNAIDALNFGASALAGRGDSFYAGNYRIYVVRDAGGAGAAPQGEMQACTAYVSATGQFTHAAYTVDLAVGDEVLLLHERIAETADLLERLTAARAGYLDRIKNLTRPQGGTQATTAALAVVGTAIENTVPFKVVGYLSLDLMQAADDFLVIEEVRDQDDATYREYGRNTYSGVQESPMVWFEEKVCQGWRIRIQRTAGFDRNVTYQFLTEVSSA